VIRPQTGLDEQARCCKTVRPRDLREWNALMPGDFLDLTSAPDGLPRQHGGTTDDGAGKPGARRFVGIHFACCDVYSRVYINRQVTAYVGHCPRCTRRVELKIGPGGTDARFFTAY
jgi:hypothetical protein